MFTLKLSNYRSFIEEEFNFSKINILIGENSSGKSSILKFLLALKQTLQTPTNSEINLLFAGYLADLGSYKDAVYYHNDKLSINFEFTFNDDYYEYALSYLKYTTKEKESRGPNEFFINKYLNGPVLVKLAYQ